MHTGWCKDPYSLLCSAGVQKNLPFHYIPAPWRKIHPMCILFPGISGFARSHLHPLQDPGLPFLSWIWHIPEDGVSASPPGCLFIYLSSSARSTARTFQRPVPPEHRQTHTLDRPASQPENRFPDTWILLFLLPVEPLHFVAGQLSFRINRIIVSLNCHYCPNPFS